MIIGLFKETLYCHAEISIFCAAKYDAFRPVCQEGVGTRGPLKPLTPNKARGCRFCPGCKPPAEIQSR